MDESDEQCMSNLGAGCDQALSVLMDRYQTMLVNHFRRRGVKDQYEDLAQETFFRIYKARKRYKPTASFKTWMFTVAQRVWIDYVRKSARRKRREDSFRAEPRPVAVQEPSHHRDEVLWALDQLPQSLRDVVVLSFFDGLSHAEISAVLDIPEGTVKSRRHHAMKRLRTLLTEVSE